MVSKTIIARLSDYFGRLGQKKEPSIKPAHVNRIIGKLEARRTVLQAELSEGGTPEDQRRIEAKLDLIGEQIARGRCLLKELVAAN